MPNPSLVESLLARLSSPDRASAMVGDLLEQNLSATSFWWTVSRIVLALTWRWMLGFALAPCFAVLSMFFIATRTMSHAHGLKPWIPLAMNFMLAAMTFGTTTALIISRYGLRHRLAVISVILWTALIVGSLFTPQPHALVVLPVVIGTGLLILLLRKKTRGLTLCVLVPAATFAVIFALLRQVAGTLPLSSGGLSLSLFFSMATLFSLAAQALVLARLHSLLPSTIPACT